MNDIFDKANENITSSFSDLVVGTARAEAVQNLNGNEKRFTREKIYEATDGKYRTKTGEVVEINADSPVSPYAYKYLCRMDDKPVFWDQVQSLDPMLRATKGMYMIKYTPRTSSDYRKGRAFKIGQDLIRWDVRVSGVKEWNKLCDKVIEFDWLRRNSTLTENMFRLAKMHPGMAMWFSVKWDEYEAKIQSQLETKAEHPFVSRKVSGANYVHDDKTLVIRTFNDILKEVNEVEALPAVQEEMQQETGYIYNRSRKVARDPVTGQFIKKQEE